MWAICKKIAQLLTTLFDIPNILFVKLLISLKLLPSFHLQHHLLKSTFSTSNNFSIQLGWTDLWNSYVLNYTQVGCRNEVYIIKRSPCSLNRFHVCILLFGKLFGTAWDWLQTTFPKCFIESVHPHLVSGLYMSVYHIQNSVQICVPILTHEHEILETVEWGIN